MFAYKLFTVSPVLCFALCGIFSALLSLLWVCFVVYFHKQLFELRFYRILICASQINVAVGIRFEMEIC